MSPNITTIAKAVATKLIMMIVASFWTQLAEEEQNKIVSFKFYELEVFVASICFVLFCSDPVVAGPCSALAAKSKLLSIVFAVTVFLCEVFCRVSWSLGSLQPWKSSAGSSSHCTEITHQEGVHAI